MTCEHCGGQAHEPCPDCGQIVHVGDWPWCPHGRSAMAVVPDDIPGGQVFENGFDTPRRFYSHSAHRAALAAEGKQIAAKWAGPNDKHLKRWDAPDAQTLANAKVLLQRAAQRRREHKAALLAAYPITVTEMDETFTYEVGE